MGPDQLFSSLQPGQQIGPYTILSPLGSGGMGEVSVRAT